MRVTCCRLRIAAAPQRATTHTCTHTKEAAANDTETDTAMHTDLHNHSHSYTALTLSFALRHRVATCVPGCAPYLGLICSKSMNESTISERRESANGCAPVQAGIREQAGAVLRRGENHSIMTELGIGTKWR